MSEWKIDSAHATVEFKTRHLGISWVRGIVNGAEGSVNLNIDDLKSLSFEATMDTSSINSGMAMRDGHLKGADFLDVEKFPKSNLKSISVESVQGNMIKVKANLTLKGITKEVISEVTYLGQQTKMNQDGTTNNVIAFSATAEIDRRDFNMLWNVDLPGGKVLIGNEIYLQIDVEALQ